MLHIYLTNAPGDLRYGTSGRAVPGYELRLVDEAGGEVGVGEIGEMLVRGPSHAEGYWNQREKSRRTFEGAWTRTGDKYVREADGRFICCGRTDDMFKVSGIWVSPFEVEAALISHDAVLEAAVVPAEDSEGLLKPKAYIVLEERRRRRRAPRRGAEGARQERHRPVEIPALDRGRRQPAEDRDGEDPAVQAEGGSLGCHSGARRRREPGTHKHRRCRMRTTASAHREGSWLWLPGSALRAAPE